MKSVAILFFSVSGFAILASGAASAQSSELCDILWVKSQRAAAAATSRTYRDFVAKCPRDARAGAARMRIADFERAQQARAVEAERQRQAERNRRRREEESWRPPPPPPPPAPPAVVSRQISIENACSYKISVRLLYRTTTGLTYAYAPDSTEGAVWNVEAGETIRPMLRGSIPLFVTSDEIYYQSTDSSGAWQTNGTWSFDYGSSKLLFMKAYVTIDSAGDFHIRFAPIP